MDFETQVYFTTNIKNYMLTLEKYNPGGDYDCNNADHLESDRLNARDNDLSDISNHDSDEGKLPNVLMRCRGTKTPTDSPMPVNQTRDSHYKG